MKTNQIMTVYLYESCGGPIKAIPVTDVEMFIQRILDRLQDVADGMQLETVIKEIKEIVLE